jgi:hypothetical protein
VGVAYSLLRAKRPGREADQSQSNAEIKNGGAVPPFDHKIFMTWSLIKHRDNFGLTYFFSPKLGYL